MLDVELTHQIILLHYVEGLSTRKIARKLNINRKTVSSRIEQYNRLKNGSGTENAPIAAELVKYLETGTVYDSSGRNVRKLTAAITGCIDTCLAENGRKRLDGLRKQQLKKIDIHEIVVAAGFEVSYSSVCKYIAGKALQIQESFIKQDYEPGVTCEFDWGEVIVYISGQRRRYYLAVFTSAYSNYRYAILFERQHSLAFREAHIIFFAHVGGIWRQMTYDNMRVAVAQFVGKNEKVPTPALMQLSRWYLFGWRFCNAARGNEKGHVERSVEYIRRKTFAFKDHFETFQEAQQYLATRVSVLNKRVAKAAQMSPYDKLQEEKTYLLAHPGKMECFDGERSKVDKFATICIGSNRYSVPDRLTGRIVFVKIYSSVLEISDEQGVVCTHPRSYERGGWYIDLDHYLLTLSRKPGAVQGSLALKQAPEWIQQLYKHHFRGNPRGFVELLQYCKANEVTDARLKATIERLMHHHSGSVEADHILALLGNQPDPVVIPTGMHQPDALATQAMENLAELTSLMG